MKITAKEKMHETSSRKILIQQLSQKDMQLQVKDCRVESEDLQAYRWNPFLLQNLRCLGHCATQET